MRYVCSLCGYVYDEAEGAPDGGVKPGTAFEDLPEDWVCPLCGAPREAFRLKITNFCSVKRFRELPGPLYIYFTRPCFSILRTLSSIRIAQAK